MTDSLHCEAARHATVYGSPGSFARSTGLMRSAWLPLVTAFAAGYLLRMLVPVPRLSLSQTGILLILAGAAFAVGMALAGRRLAAYMKGARGEERVAHELAFLPAGYHVFHGLLLASPAARKPIECDHVVVGPTGVYVIETKNWQSPITVRDGRVLYDGRNPSRPPLQQVKRAAARVRQQLAAIEDGWIDVEPVLCFASNSVQNGVQGAAGVVICNVDRLSIALQDTREGTLNPERIAACVAALLETAKTAS